MAVETGSSDGWRRCSSCKVWMEFQADHFVCNVSTCNRKRTGLVFCSVSCWEVHLPTMNHRESWAVERRGPTRGEWAREQAEAAASGEGGGERATRRILPAPTAAAPARPIPARAAAPPREVLIIASRLRDYVQARAGLKVSDAVLSALSDWVRAVSDAAIANTRAAERKTMLERDVPTPKV